MNTLSESFSKMGFIRKFAIIVTSIVLIFIIGIIGFAVNLAVTDLVYHKWYIHMMEENKDINI